MKTTEHTDLKYRVNQKEKKIEHNETGLERTEWQQPEGVLHPSAN